MDRNLWHISYEAGILEDPWFDPTTLDNRGMYKLSVDPELAPDEAQYIELSFEKGNCIAVDGVALSPSQVVIELNKIAGRHGIGRVDLVENRFVGMKSRGVYETPGGTILLHAHRQIETLTMDRDLMHLRDSLVPRYAELIYYGFWFAPEREALQALIDQSQETITGTVRLKLYKGNVITVGRKSDFSLYDEAIASMEDNESDYLPEDAGGFIRLNALRLKERNRKQGYKG
jgi:argininosuccinate synthase